MAGTLTIHYGYPGSGKTLFAMKDVILPAVKEHRPFFTNITGISLAALSGMTGVHPAFIKYYTVNDINDIIRYFNDDKVCHDGVFVLDEMKDFIDNKQAIEWLEHCINFMRKQTVDFVMIAQQPAKEYIHPNICALCTDSLVFVPRKEKGDCDNVDMYYVRGGIPKIVDLTPVNAVGQEIRKKPTEMYSTYQTSENAFYQGKEDKTFRGLPWYRTRKWKFRFIIIGLFVLIAAIIGLTIYGMLGVSDVVTIPTTKKAGQNGKQNIVAATAAPVVKADSVPCYREIICDERDCVTDVFTVPRQYYNDSTGVVCGVGSRCYRKCFERRQKADSVSSGGGLLRFGK